MAAEPRRAWGASDMAAMNKVEGAPHPPQDRDALLTQSCCEFTARGICPGIRSSTRASWVGVIISRGPGAGQASRLAVNLLCKIYLVETTMHRPYQPSAAYVLKRDSANDITITQMFITLAIMLEVY